VSYCVRDMLRHGFSISPGRSVFVICAGVVSLAFHGRLQWEARLTPGPFDAFSWTWGGASGPAVGQPRRDCPTVGHPDRREGQGQSGMRRVTTRLPALSAVRAPSEARGGPGGRVSGLRVQGCRLCRPRPRSGRVIPPYALFHISGYFVYFVSNLHFSRGPQRFTVAHVGHAIFIPLSLLASRLP